MLNTFYFTLSYFKYILIVLLFFTFKKASWTRKRTKAHVPLRKICNYFIPLSHSRKPRRSFSLICTFGTNMVFKHNRNSNLRQILGFPIIRVTIWREYTFLQLFLLKKRNRYSKGVSRIVLLFCTYVSLIQHRIPTTTKKTLWFGLSCVKK